MLKKLLKKYFSNTISQEIETNKISIHQYDFLSCYYETIIDQVFQSYGICISVSTCRYWNECIIKEDLLFVNLGTIGNAGARIYCHYYQKCHIFICYHDGAIRAIFPPDYLMVLIGNQQHDNDDKNIEEEPSLTSNVIPFVPRHPL